MPSLRHGRSLLTVIIQVIIILFYSTDSGRAFITRSSISHDPRGITHGLLARGRQCYASSQTTPHQPFTVEIFNPSQIKLIRYLGEQRLTIEEEIEPRDGTR